jgi:hypothetical protein
MWRLLSDLNFLETRPKLFFTQGLRPECPVISRLWMGSKRYVSLNFLFSSGDFIATLNLVGTAVPPKALGRCREAEYQEWNKELISLETLLDNQETRAGGCSEHRGSGVAVSCFSKSANSSYTRDEDREILSYAVQTDGC